jgi:hypothetical protein
MVPVRLLTRTGEYVTTVTIPPFSPLVEIIRWGERLFVLNQNTQEYCEGIAWVIPLEIPSDVE